MLTPFLFVLLAVLAGLGCSGGEEAGPPPEATSSTIHDGSYRPAAELLALLGRERGCRDPWTEPAFLIEGEPPALEALGCYGLVVRTYGHNADVEAALRVSEGFCSYRVVGERWIIAVDDEEHAVSVAGRLGGDLWESPACEQPQPPEGDEKGQSDQSDQGGPKDQGGSADQQSTTSNVGA